MLPSSAGSGMQWEESGTLGSKYLIWGRKVVVCGSKCHILGIKVVFFWRKYQIFGRKLVFLGGKFRFVQESDIWR